VLSPADFPAAQRPGDLGNLWNVARAETCRFWHASVDGATPANPRRQLPGGFREPAMSHAASILDLPKTDWPAIARPIPGRLRSSEGCCRQAWLSAFNGACVQRRQGGAHILGSCGIAWSGCWRSRWEWARLTARFRRLTMTFPSSAAFSSG